jgi:hypothetical protein
MIPAPSLDDIAKRIADGRRTPLDALAACQQDVFADRALTIASAHRIARLPADGPGTELATTVIRQVALYPYESGSWHAHAIWHHAAAAAAWLGQPPPPGGPNRGQKPTLTAPGPARAAITLASARGFWTARITRAGFSVSRIEAAGFEARHRYVTGIPPRGDTETLWFEVFTVSPARFGAALEHQRRNPASGEPR